MLGAIRTTTFIAKCVSGTFEDSKAPLAHILKTAIFGPKSALRFAFRARALAELKDQTLDGPQLDESFGPCICTFYLAFSLIGGTSRCNSSSNTTKLLDPSTTADSADSSQSFSRRAATSPQASKT